jgi:hypothetical protein
VTSAKQKKYISVIEFPLAKISGIAVGTLNKIALTPIDAGVFAFLAVSVTLTVKHNVRCIFTFTLQPGFRYYKRSFQFSPKFYAGA